MFTVTFAVVPFLLATWNVAISVSETNCVSNYNDFVDHTFGNNSENTQKLCQAFYPPNGHLPYSVLVTYQTMLPNGTVLNISTDPSCTDEQVWMWLSSPVLLFEEPVSLNRHILFTLNLFEEWIPPHIYITCPYPCQKKAEEFLQEMTTSLQSYAFRGADGGKHRGNFAKYCSNTKFIYNSEIMANVAVVGFIILAVFVLFAPALLHDCVQEYLLPDKGKEKSPNYNYTYGIFWGFSATAFFFDSLVLYNDMNTLMAIFADIGPNQQYLWGFGIIFVLLFCIPFSIYYAYGYICSSEFELAIPGIYLRPVQCLCCNEKCARLVVTSFTMLFNLVAVQLLLHHGVMVILVLPIAPVAIATNVMLLVLVGTCVIHMSATLFICCASPRESCRNLPVILLLSAILLFGVLIAYTTKYVNTATENGSYLTVLQSIFVPVIFGGASLGIKKFMHWLSQQQKEQSTSTSPTSPEKHPGDMEDQNGAPHSEQG